MTVVASDVTTLFSLTEQYEAACLDALATTQAGAPDLHFVSPGVPAFEYQCDALAVYCQSLTEEATGPLNPPPQTGYRHSRGRMNLASLVAIAVRCADAQLDQPADVLTAEARKVLEDGWAMWNVITQKIRNGTLFDGPCTDVHFDGGVPLTPQGGIVGWQFTVRVEIGGYALEES